MLGSRAWCMYRMTLISGDRTSHSSLSPTESKQYFSMHSIAQCLSKV